ncbi:hypothetical protein [Sphingomonas sanguinis]|uniref:hypothetical protein n=1 Tax=Sphingomonas sanguinis TaxID=33051 RepID=UPI00128EEC4F|nr:hypothetical protein [Sphingomonas sanguinis]
MEVDACIVDRGDILVSEINEFSQIYRYDDCRVHVVRGNQSFTFDIPSTEWLERFTEFMKDLSCRECHEILRGSGYKFDISNNGDSIDMDVYDIDSMSVETLHMSHEDAMHLHDSIFSCIIEPFLEQGGQLKQLGDVDRFRL